MAITSRSISFVGAVVALLLIVGTILAWRLREPPSRHVDGSYRGSCGAITISNNVARLGGATAPFRFESFKFGSAGVLDRPLGPFYVPTLDGRKEPGTLIFDNNAVTAVRFDRKECVFKRAS